MKQKYRLNKLVLLYIVNKIVSVYNFSSKAFAHATISNDRLVIDMKADNHEWPVTIY